MRLLRVSFGQLHRNRGQVTKQPSGTMIRSGGKVDLCSWCGSRIAVSRTNIPRAEGPDAIDGQRLPACILQQSIKFTRSQIVRSDEATGLGVSSTCELPDEQVVTEASEIQRSQRHTPGSVQPITVFQSL